MTWLPRLPPRLPLGTLPTPLVDAPRLRAELGCGPLRIKRDDLAGFGIAGNKTRPLEYLLGDAQAHGMDVLVTGGGPDSNFVAAAAMAARVAGIACELVVWGGASLGPTPNLALAAAAGARLVPLGDDRRERVDVVVAERAAELRAAGRRPLAVPRGGSTPVGAAGFARAAAELLDQCVRLDGAFPATVVLPLGSGGSTAGLLVGLAAAGADTTVLAVSVSRPPEEITPRCWTSRAPAPRPSAPRRRGRTASRWSITADPASGARRPPTGTPRRRSCAPRDCCSTTPTAPRRSPSPSRACGRGPITTSPSSSGTPAASRPP
ncbi:pyridoxal-phosphate dependent enzyme [Actinomycetospora sp. CA-053990]|uniref:pyridoxal-phosphate dependent enzyme n=1 Tax=Actinomycetospora sp. CA-053990 TaxID=3239891 RepID=UPI003D8DDDFB